MRGFILIPVILVAAFCCLLIAEIMVQVSHTSRGLRDEVRGIRSRERAQSVISARLSTDSAKPCQELLSTPDSEDPSFCFLQPSLDPLWHLSALRLLSKTCAEEPHNLPRPTPHGPFSRFTCRTLLIDPVRNLHVRGNLVLSQPFEFHNPDGHRSPTTVFASGAMYFEDLLLFEEEMALIAAGDLSINSLRTAGAPQTVTLVSLRGAVRVQQMTGVNRLSLYSYFPAELPPASPTPTQELQLPTLQALLVGVNDRQIE